MSVFDTEQFSATTTLNLVRDGVELPYRDSIPMAEAGQKSFAGIGQALASNPDVANKWLSSLINRVGGVIIHEASIANPLAQFKRGIMNAGAILQEIAVDASEERIFNPAVAETNLYKMSDTETRVKAIYHTATRDVIYKESIQNTVIQEAFTGADPVNAMADRIIKAMSNGNNYNEFFTMKNLFTQALAGNAITAIEVEDVKDAETAKKFQTQLMNIVDGMQFPSRSFNKTYGASLPGRLLQTDKDDLRIFIPYEMKNILNVDFFANMFQIDRVEVEARMVILDYFPSAYVYTADHKVTAEDLQNGTLDPEQFKVNDTVAKGTVARAKADGTAPTDATMLFDGKRIKAVVADVNALQVYDVFKPYLTSAVNPEGRYVNVTFHAKQRVSWSSFVNAVALVSAETPADPSQQG